MNNEDKKIQNNDADVADKVLAFIEKENVQPHSKWYFFLTNDVFWALGVMSVFVGSLCFALILFTYFNAEAELYQLSYDSFYDFFIEWVPILWIISLSLFTYVGYKNIQHTKRGYRYSFSMVIFVSLLLSVLGGIALYSYGLAAAFDNEFERRLPVYRSVQGLKKDLALRLERGGIGGEVVSVADDVSSFVVKDFRGSVWVVSTSDLADQDRVFISENRLVRVIGIPSTTTIGVLGTSTMHACIVLPWEVRGEPERVLPPKERMAMMEQNFRERKENTERINMCKGVQPYMIIQEMRNKIHQ